MSVERWIRGNDETAGFDWRRPARELDVPLDIARALYLRALQSEIDPRRIEALFLAWLRAAAAARQTAAAPPVPGRRTQVLHGRDGSRTPQADDLRRLGPGKWTRVLLDAEREVEAAGATDGATAEARGLPTYDDVQRAAGAPGAVSRQPDEPHPVPVASSSAAAGAAALRAQLRAAVESGHGAAEALSAADPAAAVEALSALRGEHLPSRAAPVLRLVAEAAGGERRARCSAVARSGVAGCRRSLQRGWPRTSARRRRARRDCTPTTPRRWSPRRTTPARSRSAPTSSSAAASTRPAPRAATSCSPTS